MNNNCHVVNICRNYGSAPRDEAKEAVLGEIIAHKSAVVLSFLNDTCTDGLERQDEEAGYDNDQTMEEEGHRDDGSGDRTESGSAVASPARYIY